MTPSPTSFTGSPGRGAAHPQPTPMNGQGYGYSSPTAPRVPYVRVPSGPANTLPLLSLASPNTCTLTKPLLTALGLAPNSPFDLIAPLHRGGQWLLDTRPRRGAGYVVPSSARCVLRVRPVAQVHFQRPEPTFAGPEPGAPFVGNRNVTVPLLLFRLGTELPDEPGSFVLEPVTHLPAPTAEERQQQRNQRKREQSKALQEQAANGVARAIERLDARRESKRAKTAERQKRGL